MDHLKLTPDKLSVDAVSELVVNSSCGAVSIFVGTTRDNFEGKTVLRLEYEAYEPMALKAMKSICDEVRSKWPAVHSIAMYHRLGEVPTREASVVIAVSSPHRQASLEAVAHLIDQLKSSVPIWKKEVYDTNEGVWKENVECGPTEGPPRVIPEEKVDKNAIQLNVSYEELQQRIQNFIESKREQVNVSNIHDFIPSAGATDDEDVACARVRTQFVKRTDSKGHLKVRRVHNVWGPQLSRAAPVVGAGGVEERLAAAERALGGGRPVPRDVYHRLRELELRLQQLAPEYRALWNKEEDRSQHLAMDYVYSADDIARKIEQLEKEASI